MKKTGLVVATAVAGLFLAGSVMAEEAAAPAADKVEKVGCMGINACKGKGVCKTAENACAGHNACKGKGIVKVTKEECESQGGKVQS